MKGMLKGVAALALATMFAASSAQAQAKFGVAGTGLFSLESGGGSAKGCGSGRGWGGCSARPGRGDPWTALRRW